MSLTSTQRQAIAARGNVLVVAGAGTGKTRTLVERCLSCLLEEKPPASLEEILMVTFTDAAAAEMRQRIRVRLEAERGRDPGNPRWQEQLALFETAHIGTLHSFCLRLVRQHFYELALDPQLSVLPEEEARLLANETLEAVLQNHYAGRTAGAEAVQQLIEAQGRGWDKPIRALVLRLHHYAQTRPDPAAWFNRQLDLFNASNPDQWLDWLLRGIADWREGWLPRLEVLAPQNELAGKCAAALEPVVEGMSRAEAAAALATITVIPRSCPHGKKTAWVKPLEKFFGEAEFLLSVADTGAALTTAAAGGGVVPPDALAQDWNWVRSQMATLLQLVREFDEAFTEAKRELGVVDFHDIEQYTLRLLWDTATNQPTPVARQGRDKLRFLFVDEYQDINAAQDKIIEALSREGVQANRFLVGDVKQSIYRFRLAEPRIFQRYAETWRDGRGRVIPLADNFRSREGILRFINALFAVIMRPEMGGLNYDAEAQLRFGATKERRGMSAAAKPAPCVELHLLTKGAARQPEESEAPADGQVPIAELDAAEKEARLVALRLRELRAAGHAVWDEGAQGFRPVRWSDMAVLLRSPAHKAESYAKAFDRLRVPLLVARSGFYESLEITDLLSLLQVLDNPIQDLPLLAVLHSPLVGLDLDELATIRLAVIKAPFWSALLQWEKTTHAELAGDANPSPAVRSTEAVSRLTQAGSQSANRTETLRKVSTFLKRFAHWRRMARQLSLSRCLEDVLAETHYAAWLLTQPRGDQRHANVQRLLALAQQFDQFQRQGLFRFLRFIEAQQVAETEPDVAPVTESDCVRLMSIHQSKGLEFPVVVVADLGKAFNESDLRAEVILDEEYGLCPQIKPPHVGSRYPSLPYWLARRRQHREMLGEELRLLYVAMTRARDLLILAGSVTEKKLDEVWRGGRTFDAAELTSARSYADWLGHWFSQKIGSQEGASQGDTTLLRWAIHDETKLMEPDADATPTEESVETRFTGDAAVWEKLQQRLAWVYPFTAATRQPAKTSVTALRRRAAELLDEEASPFPEAGRQRSEDGGQRTEVRDQKPRSPRGGAEETAARFHSAQHRPGATAADRGNAHHQFLEFVSLARTGSADELKAEAGRLQRAGVLTAEMTALLDFPGLAAFWQSNLGRQVRAQADSVRRELAFTARFAPNELGQLTGVPADPALEGEFVVVQGLADLIVVLPQELWLVDFKTDALAPGATADKLQAYAPQLKLYARALSRIYQRPVSQCWLYFLAARKAEPVDLQ